MILDFLNLGLPLDIKVRLVTCSLPLKASNYFFDIFFNSSELIFGHLLSGLDLSGNLIVEFLIFHNHFVFKFSDLELDYLVSLFNL